MRPARTVIKIDYRGHTSFENSRRPCKLTAQKLGDYYPFEQTEEATPGYKSRT